MKDQGPIPFPHHRSKKRSEAAPRALAGSSRRKRSSQHPEFYYTQEEEQHIANDNTVVHFPHATSSLWEQGESGQGVTGEVAGIAASVCPMPPDIANFIKEKRQAGWNDLRILREAAIHGIVTTRKEIIEITRELRDAGVLADKMGKRKNKPLSPLPPGLTHFKPPHGSGQQQ